MTTNSYALCHVSRVRGLHSAVVILLLMGLLLNAAPPAAAQSKVSESVLDVQKPMPSIQTNLHDAMTEIARIYETPMLIVLKADHAVLDLPAGKMTLRDVLDSAVRQNPRYRWEEVTPSVIYFRDAALEKDPLYFLAWKLKWFPIFGNVSQVDHLLRPYIQNVRYHATQAGGANSAIDEKDPQWKKHSLPRVEMTDVTPVDVVVKTMEMDRRFCTIIEFPGPGPLKDSDLDAAFISWRWIPFETNP